MKRLGTKMNKCIKNKVRKKEISVASCFFFIIFIFSPSNDLLAYHNKYLLSELLKEEENRKQSLEAVVLLNLVC